MQQQLIDQDKINPKPPKKPTKRKWIWRVLLLLLILSLPIVLWLSLPLYWHFINPLLRDKAGIYLSIESVNTGFDGANPSIVLKNVKIYSDQSHINHSKNTWRPATLNWRDTSKTPLLELDQAAITVDLHSITSLKPVLKQARVEQLTVHGWQDPSHNYWLAGFEITPSKDSSTPIDWMWIRQQQAHISQAKLVWHSAANATIALPLTLVDIPILSILKTERGHVVDARIIPERYLGEPIEIKGSLAHSHQSLNGQGGLKLPLVQMRHIPDIFFLPNSASRTLSLIDTVSIQGNLSWTPSTKDISTLSANLDTHIKPHAFKSIKHFTLTASATAKHQTSQSVLQKASIQAQFNDWLTATASMSQPTDRSEYNLDLAISTIYIDQLMDELSEFDLLQALPAELQKKQWIGEVKNLTAHVSGLTLKHQLEYQSASAGLFIQAAGWKVPIVSGAINLQSKPITIKNKSSNTHQVQLAWNLDSIQLPALGLTLTQLLNGAGKEWAKKAFKSGELAAIKGDLALSFNSQKNQILNLKSHLQSQVKQLGLNYWSTYPAVDQVDGNLSLTYNPKTQTHDAKLLVKSGKILNYQLSHSTVEFNSIEKNSLLSVKANASGDVSNLLSFVQQAPLPIMIKQPLEGLSGSGSSSLQFQMDLPIGNASAQLAIAAHASFAQASFTHKELGRFNLSGDAGWRGEKVYSLDGLTAESDLGQVKVDAFDLAKRTRSLHAQGYLIYGELLSLLAKQGQNPEQIRYILKGENNSKIGFDLESNPQVDLWFNNRLNIDLSDLSIDIPTLLQKPTKTPLRLSLATQQIMTVKPVAESPSDTLLVAVKLVQANQPPILDIEYKLDKKNLKSVRSGHIAIGRSVNRPLEQNALFNTSSKTGDINTNPSGGDLSEIKHTVVADVFSQTFDLDQLRNWLNNIPENKTKEKPQEPITPDQLHVWANTFGTSIDKVAPYRGFIPTKWTIQTSNLIYKTNKTGALNIELITSNKYAKMQVQHKNMDGFIEWRNNQDKQAILGRFGHIALSTQTSTETPSKPRNTTEKDQKNKSKIPNTNTDQSGLEKTKQAFKPWQNELLLWSAQPFFDANLDIEVSQLLVGKDNLGTFSIKGQAFKPEPQRDLVGFVFDEISFKGAKTQITINGHWYHQPKKIPSVQLSVNVDSSDFGEFLAAVGQPKVLKDGQTQLQFVTNWDKHIAQIDFDTLSGRLDFDVKNGFILPIDSTALKVLGVLSFQNITKIFDVFNKSSQDGFAFDQLEGKTKINRGIMKLDSVKLTSPPLDARITGEVNIKQETQNLHLLVKPKVDVGNFSALYAMLVNPLLGFGTLALGLFANKAFTIDYQVTGTFEKPVLQKN